MPRNDTGHSILRKPIIPIHTINFDQGIPLADQYQMLLLLYDKVLDLSKKILIEVERKGSESNILILTEQKKVAREAIKFMTKKIASAEIKDKTAHLKTLAEAKSLLSQISEKAKLIQEVEEKIQKFLQEDDEGSR